MRASISGSVGRAAAFCEQRCPVAASGTPAFVTIDRQRRSCSNGKRSKNVNSHTDRGHGGDDVFLPRYRTFLKLEQPFCDGYRVAIRENLDKISVPEPLAGAPARSKGACNTGLSGRAMQCDVGIGGPSCSDSDGRAASSCHDISVVNLFEYWRFLHPSFGTDLAVMRARKGDTGGYQQTHAVSVSIDEIQVLEVVRYVPVLVRESADTSAQIQLLVVQFLSSFVLKIAVIIRTSAGIASCWL